MLTLSRSTTAKIKQFLPDHLIAAGRKYRSLSYIMMEFGGRYRRKCPICAHQGYFFASGWPLVPDSVCPRCRSIGRHRQHHLLVGHHPEWIDGAEVLHFAPEPCFVADYEKRANRYVRADYDPAGDEDRVDIQSMPYADQSFDTIICHNVLEHVPDDRAALAECFRVLRPGGRALFSFPLCDAWEENYENPSITDPQGRDLHFNQRDHFRYYGRDAYDRIRAAGFHLETDIAREPAVHRHALERGETIFIAMKP
jgi:SAM-dependent methyltransferase